MASDKAFSSGTSWPLLDELPGGWAYQGDEMHADGQQTETRQQSARSNSPSEPEPSAQTNDRQQRTHYAPRQCRICLDHVEPTFKNVSAAASSLPASFQSAPRVVYDSGPNEGGRLLRPCKCKGSQKYVHEECLTAWRLQDPLQKRNYWQCPTCRYKYNLQRLTWGTWLSSTTAQVGLTLAVFATATFVLGFVADPLINMYVDPVGTIAAGGSGKTGSIIFEDESVSWSEHFAKGLASLGLLGFAKFFLTLNPWSWLNMRSSGIYVGGGGRAASGNGRERLNHIHWIAIIAGILTFLWTVWKGVRAWSRRTLEAAGERVMDGPGHGDDDDGDDEKT